MRPDRGPDPQYGAGTGEGSFPVFLDGRRLTARPGQTVVGVLLNAGVRSSRTTRTGGRPRGLFCGIGVCFDCLVTVNGVPDVRGCLTSVRPGDRIGVWGRHWPGVRGSTDSAAGEDTGHGRGGGG